MTCKKKQSKKHIAGMEEYVIATLRAQNIRASAKETKKELSDNEKAAKETLIELMIASGTESLRVANNEYYVLKKKVKKAQVSSDVVQEVISNMTLADIKANANASKSASLVHAVKHHLKTRLLNGQGGEGGEEEVTFVLSSQVHEPLHFMEQTSPETADHLHAAAIAYKEADLRKRIFNGKIKDMIDDAKTGVNESNEMEAYNFATKDGTTYRQVDQAVVARAAVKSANATTQPTQPIVYVKTEKKQKLPSIPTKRFLEITDSVIQTAIESRFGNASVDENHIAELAKQSTSLADAIDACIEKKFAPDTHLIVSVVSKKPRK